MMAAHLVLLSLLGHRFGVAAEWWRQEWCASSTLMILGFDGVVLWNLGDRRALMDSRGVKAQCGIVMVGPVRGFASVYHSRDGLAQSGGGDF
jgi:hypothetical protein